MYIEALPPGRQQEQQVVHGVQELLPGERLQRGDDGVDGGQGDHFSSGGGPSRPQLHIERGGNIKRSDLLKHYSRGRNKVTCGFSLG